MSKHQKLSSVLLETQVMDILVQFKQDCYAFERDTGLRSKFFGARDKLVKLIEEGKDEPKERPTK